MLNVETAANSESHWNDEGCIQRTDKVATVVVVAQALQRGLKAARSRNQSARGLFSLHSMFISLESGALRKCREAIRDNKPPVQHRGACLALQRVCRMLRSSRNDAGPGSAPTPSVVVSVSPSSTARDKDADAASASPVVELAWFRVSSFMADSLLCGRLEE